ncbi:MAG: hypothetical protein K0R39_2142 [Symbiobacteriaceae bacterium]|jgi:uncharacterized Zn finger protein|nr:hypothetical protein [Symbiobacteriaceae bacterium]
MTRGESDVGWWGQWWLTQVIAHLPAAPTEGQLKNAARATARLRVEKGRVEAYVAVGGGARPPGAGRGEAPVGREETALLRVKPLAERDWKRLLGSLDQALTLRLLTGQFGPELETAFAAAGLELFPPQATLRCTCRAAGEDGCRHLHALLLGGVTMLDSNPFLWLEVLGRSRAELQAALQARLAESRPPAAEAPGPGAPPGGAHADADTFWETATDPDAIPVSAGDTAAPPDALLRRLGPLPLPEETAWVEMIVTKTAGRGDEARPVLTRAARPLDAILREYVGYIGEATRALTTGDMPPMYLQEPLPGKAVPLSARVLPEVEQAIRQEAGLLSVAELTARAPTAAALPGKLGRTAVAEALGQLPPDMVVLARRYAGPRIAALAGRAFCHIITFDEWRRGRFTTDADWHRALEAAGATAALPPGLWQHLRPETGDELWLTVADPAGPFLQAELLPRRVRRPTLDARSLPAARALLGHMADTGQWGIPEEEAVAVLLAEGHYEQREQQDEAWLLPFQVQGISAGRPQRTLTREERPWQPGFGRATYHGWADLETALKGWPETAARAIRWWCQSWPGAQDRPGTVPNLGALLELLWIKAPRDAVRHDLQPELLPNILAEWFQSLEDRYPAVAGLYEAHMLACGRGELYEHRLRTLPEPGAPDTETLAWIVEGYRWIGAERCWEGGGR